MKKLSYSIMSACLTLAFTTSCSDFLEAENKSAGGDKTDTEVYFRTQEGIQGFRAYAFNSLKAVATALDINEDGTDLYSPCRGQAPSQFQEYSLNAENGDVEDYYVACMGIVNNANGMVYYSGDNFPLYKAEGQFLRAYGYYLLTQQFGAVPYSDAYIQDANRNYPRTDLQTIYTNIENDLVEVINSSVVPDITHDGSVNKRAARALLAKVYLAHGWDCDVTLTDTLSGYYDANYSTDNFVKAAAMAEEAISGISLTQPFEDKWNPYNEDTNPETFFSVQYDKAGWPGDVSDGGHSLAQYYTHYYGDENTGVKYSRSNKALNTRSLALWEKGDTRWEGTFMTTIYAYETVTADWFKSGYFAYYNSAVDKNSLPIMAYYAPTYVTREEFEAYLTEHKSQFIRAEGALKAVHANLLHNGTIYVYRFNENGDFRYEQLNKETNEMETVELIDVTSQSLNDNNKGTSLETTPPVKKWDDPTSTMGSRSISYRDIVLLHASEIYLTAAEAYIMAGNEGAAWEKINAVRDRAGAPALNNSLENYEVPVMFSTFRMIDLLLDERARECYAEQTRWVDLRRTKQLVHYNVAYNPYVVGISSMRGVGDAIKWYRPIPTTEISSNDGMSQTDQNPGY